MSILNLFNLDGQKAVVTGASKGIGREIALCLAEAGVDVVVSARSQDCLDELAAQIEALGRRARGIPADLSVPSNMEYLADEAAACLGGITLWVNNIGGKPDKAPRAIVDIEPEDFDAHIDLVLKSVWRGSVEAARRMGAGGSIINISSRVAARGTHVGHGLYAAVKSAVNGLTATLAAELAPFIRVNAIAPGPILSSTLYAARGWTPAQADEQLPSLGIPMRRYGTPRDIGAAVVFLASPAASWITGQCLYVTGGLV